LIDETIISDVEEIDRRGHKGPERRCVGTNMSYDRSLMIRFVKGPDGQIVPDISEKLPGRGVWTLAKRSALEAAISKGGFSRGLKTKTDVSPELVAQTESLLRRKVLSLVTMALKAGQAYIGFDQVKSAAGQMPLAWRIEASDGSEGGRGKIRVLTKAVSRDMGQKPTPVIGCFTASELGHALGRTDMVHAAIRPGPMKKVFDHAAARLGGFCDLVPENWPDKAHEQDEINASNRGDKG